MCLSTLVHRPDLEIEQDTFKDYEYAITFNDMGYRCGYVKLLPGHPWYGKDYQKIWARAHGGLTFSEADLPCDKAGADDGWWIGFDCGHRFDAPAPDLLKLPRWISPLAVIRREATIRTTDYVRANIQSLIDQAIAATE
jgi:hypothetical protein